MKHFTPAEDAALREGYLAGNQSDYRLKRWCHAHGITRPVAELKFRVQQLDYFRADQPWLQEQGARLRLDADRALMREVQAARREAAGAPLFRPGPAEIDKFLGRTP